MVRLVWLDSVGTLVVGEPFSAAVMAPERESVGQSLTVEMNLGPPVLLGWVVVELKPAVELS